MLIYDRELLLVSFLQQKIELLNAIIKFAQEHEILFYIPWPFPPVWGVADNTKKTTKQWGLGYTPLF